MPAWVRAPVLVLLVRVLVRVPAWVRAPVLVLLVRVLVRVPALLLVPVLVLPVRCGAGAGAGAAPPRLDGTSASVEMRELICRALGAPRLTPEPV